MWWQKMYYKTTDKANREFFYVIHGRYFVSVYMSFGKLLLWGFHDGVYAVKVDISKQRLKFSQWNTLGYEYKENNLTQHNERTRGWFLVYIRDIEKRKVYTMNSVTATGRQSGIVETCSNFGWIIFTHIA